MVTVEKNLDNWKKYCQNLINNNKKIKNSEEITFF